MFDFMKAWEAAQATWDDPNGVVMQMRERAQRNIDYLNDPSIPEHEKDLQMALDCDMSDPRPVIEHKRKVYEYWCRTGELLDDGWLGSRKFHSVEEYVESLKQAVSEEAVNACLKDYETHLALRKEAIEKGFVKGGYGRRQGDA